MTESELVFVNGLNHIGGTQLVLRTDDAELFFDLGLGQTESAALFNSTVPPGMMNEPLVDYLCAGMAPLAEGLFDEDHLGGSVAEFIAPLRASGRFLEGAPYFPESDHERAVFISHLHSDHAGLLPFLHPRQQVVMSSLGAELQRLLERAGIAGPCAANIRPYPHGSRVTVGDIELTLMNIDHDTPGAMGFIAQTPGGRVAYTGDWRYHGLNPGYLDAFAEECRTARVDVLITEASTAQPPGVSRWPWGGGLPAELFGGAGPGGRPLAEERAGEVIDELISRASGLVFLCMHRQHLERVDALGRSLAASGRSIVVDPQTARFWRDAAAQGVIKVDQSLILSYEGKQAVGLPTVPMSTLHDNRDSFVCQLSAPSYGAMLALALGPEDLIIHANGHPLGSQYPGWRTLVNWAHQLGCPLAVVDSHGHAEEEALRRLVRNAQPQRIIPVHSDHPTECALPADQTYLPRRWERMPLAG